MSFIKIFNKEEISINLERLEKRVMQSSKKTPDWVNKLIDECLEECTPEPKAVYSFFDFKISDNTINIQGVDFKSANLVSKFKYSSEVGLFITTIGSDLEDRSANSEDSVKMLVYDAIGSEYVESTANGLHKFLERKKEYCMRRFSPGYGDWDICDQKKLFSLISGDVISVSLNESYIMSPEKSISGIIGYSEDSSKDCRECDMKNCNYRGLK